LSTRSKLLWRCRRGTRELDELLRGFLDSRWDTLDAGERVAFERLLEAPDPDLRDWLTGRADPPDAALAGLVRAIVERPR